MRLVSASIVVSKIASKHHHTQLEISCSWEPHLHRYQRTEREKKGEEREEVEEDEYDEGGGGGKWVSEKLQAEASPS